jgi:aryl-alcohol dehydrogenase-like predicted oxidoreductase
MRLSTDPDRDEATAIATLEAALEAGATVLDTAPSYAHGEEDAHHNERLVARALASRVGPRPLVSTKGGLRREGRAWVVDGRAKSIRASCERSVEALGAPIDLYLLHAVDPKTPLATSVRALAELERAGLVCAVGLSNATVDQIEEARRHADIRAVQIAAGAFDGAAFRGGVVRHCRAAGIDLYAHSPFGGPKRAPRLARDELLSALAEEHDVSAYAIVVAWLAARGLVGLPGARRPERVRAALAGARLALAPETLARLDDRFGVASPLVPARAAGVASAGEVVIVMGIQAAGKSEHVRSYEARGYTRLNRDLLGGRLRGLAQRLDELAKAGSTRFVLDNTYTTRASRAEVVSRARKHGLDVRCVHLDTPLEQAQINAVERLLDRYGRLPSPEELRPLQRTDPQAFAPTVLFRTRRELEAPSEEEGFAAIERVPFERQPRADHTRAAIVVEHRALTALSADALGRLRDEAGAEVSLVFGWTEGAVEDRLRAEWAEAAAAAALPRPTIAICPHAAGPPICWCRPPLPGLIVPWLREQGVDATRSLLVGTHPAHDAMARALGMRGVRA